MIGSGRVESEARSWSYVRTHLNLTLLKAIHSDSATRTSKNRTRMIEDGHVYDCGEELEAVKRDVCCVGGGVGAVTD
jgi:hypothetical protein